MTELELQNVVDGIFQNMTGLEVLHDNEEYSGSADEWLRVCVQNAKGKRITLGNNPVYRYYGVCFVQIFVKPGTGSGRALEIADSITPIIRDKLIHGVQFFVPNVIRIGEYNGWYQVNVLTDFYRED